jgi:hypothetical protein
VWDNKRQDVYISFGQELAFGLVGIVAKKPTPVCFPPSELGADDK